MKSLWADLSLKVDMQDKIQKELLMNITKQKFRGKLNYLRVPELIGSFVCVGYAMYLLSQFSNFELWYNQVLVLINVLILIALPVASLSAIKRMQNLRIDTESPAIILDKFVNSRIQFWKVQRYGLIFGGIIMITILPPLAELNGSQDKISNPLFWMIYIPGGILFLYLISRYAMKKYRGVIDSAEKMLQDID